MPELSFRMTPFLKIISVLTLILAAYMGYAYIHDEMLLKTVSVQVPWIENFYTNNARFPSKAEFEHQFPTTKLGDKLGDSITYAAIPDEGANDYLYTYNLSAFGKFRGISIEYGSPQKDIFGSIVYFQVSPRHQ